MYVNATILRVISHCMFFHHSWQYRHFNVVWIFAYISASCEDETKVESGYERGQARDRQGDRWGLTKAIKTSDENVVEKDKKEVQEQNMEETIWEVSCTVSGNTMEREAEVDGQRL